MAGNYATPLVDEARQHRLRVAGRVPVGDGAGHGEGVHQRGRHDHEAQAQAGVQRLGERAHIQHPLRPRQAAQRGHALGCAAVLEFAVVIVFHHPGVVRARPVQQRLPPRQGHAHARGELVRRRDHGHARGGPLGGAVVNAQALRVQRHGPRQRAVA